MWFISGCHIQVKPLGVIWGKYEEFYNRRNTIMFDDIGRNFLMNPQNGLKVGDTIGTIILSSFIISVLTQGCVFCTQIDPTLHEGPPEQRERQGAV